MMKTQSDRPKEDPPISSEFVPSSFAFFNPPLYLVHFRLEPFGLVEQNQEPNGDLEFNIEK